VTNQPKLRQTIAELPTYKAGKKVAGVTGLAPYKLSSNENPTPPLPSVIKAITEAASEINRYPDPFVTELTDALAKKFSVNPNMIATGTGSVGVCQQIMQAVANAEDEVIYAWRSFEAYPIITKIVGAKPIQVPLSNSGAHNLPAMLDAITNRTRLIMICTPNNPTGSVVNQAELTEFLTKVPKDILVVIDEAYVEFNRDKNSVRGLELLTKFSNVGVLRTFSKAYGLASLRVGFFIGPENIAEAVRKTAVPFGVSHIAQAAALASLEHEDELLQRVNELIELRSWFEEELKTLGFNLEPSQANFVWLPLGNRTDEFVAKCVDLAVAVRPFPGEGVRISIGEKPALERVLDALSGFNQL
jgi:histidinol-phosphate aminotransferase